MRNGNVEIMSQVSEDAELSVRIGTSWGESTRLHLIRNCAVEISQELPRDAAIEVGNRETRIQTNCPVEVVDCTRMVVHSLKGHAAVHVGSGIVREEPNYLAEVGCGLAEPAHS
jgi:hypothetical protein